MLFSLVFLIFFSVFFFLFHSQESKIPPWTRRELKRTLLMGPLLKWDHQVKKKCFKCRAKWPSMATFAHFDGTGELDGSGKLLDQHMGCSLDHPPTRHPYPLTLRHCLLIWPLKATHCRQLQLYTSYLRPSWLPTWHIFHVALDGSTSSHVLVQGMSFNAYTKLRSNNRWKNI